MVNISFERVKDDCENGKYLQFFIELWLQYMHELKNERNNDKIIGHGKKIIEIQELKEKENKIYSIELCIQNGSIIGLCFYCICEIKLQKDTEYGLIIKPLVDFKDYGYIMEFYIKPEYRLKGYGSIVYNHIKDIFCKNNIETIILTSDAKAVPFWEKLNFCNSGKIDPTNDLSIFLINI
jgi:GNAT superfamily N-acetyltransferase